MSNNDLFFATFIGEYVQVVTKLTTTFTQENEEGLITHVNNIIIDGFLLDQDDLYYYLGQTSDAISSTIKIDDVSIVNISPTPDIFREILDNAEIPENKESFN